MACSTRRARYAVTKSGPPGLAGSLPVVPQFRGDVQRAVLRADLQAADGLERACGASAGTRRAAARPGSSASCTWPLSNWLDGPGVQRGGDQLVVAWRCCKRPRCSARSDLEQLVAGRQVVRRVGPGAPVGELPAVDCWRRRPYSPTSPNDSGLQVDLDASQRGIGGQLADRRLHPVDAGGIHQGELQRACPAGIPGPQSLARCLRARRYRSRSGYDATSRGCVQQLLGLR